MSRWSLIILAVLALLGVPILAGCTWHGSIRSDLHVDQPTVSAGLAPAQNLREAPADD
jgi:hypothetical protein